MGRVHVLAGVALALSVVGCGSGSGTAGNRNSGIGKSSLTETLNVVTHWPSARAIQIGLNAAIAVRFDGALRFECLQDGQTWLEERDTGNRIEGRFQLEEQGQTMVFTSTLPLQQQTWYRFRMSPLLCDTADRLMEQVVAFEFRTADNQAPSLVQTLPVDGATGVGQSGWLELQFSEDMRLPAEGEGVELREGNLLHPVRSRVSGTRVYVDLVANLAGKTKYTLSLKSGKDGLQDLSGNPLPAKSLSFTTAPDTTRPTVIASWPSGMLAKASPNAAPVFVFDESIDPDSLEAQSFSFHDQYSSAVAFRPEVSEDRRKVRLVPTKPLLAGRVYSVAPITGVGALTDMTGNTLRSAKALYLSVDTDDVAPRLLSSLPGPQAQKVSLNVQPLLRFSEALDKSRTNTDTVHLLKDGEELPINVVQQGQDKEILVVPIYDLEPGRGYTLRIDGGAWGLRDKAGNLSGQSQDIRFSTAARSEKMDFVFSPTHGATDVPPKSVLTAVSAQPLDPLTVDSNTVIVTSGTTTIKGKLTLLGGNRVLRFVPDSPLETSRWHTMTVLHGADGVRTHAGNWLTAPAQTSFRPEAVVDTTPPTALLSLNAMAERRKANQTVGPWGFEINMLFEDKKHFDVDLSSLNVTIEGLSGPIAPLGVDILAQAEINEGSLRFTVPKEAELPPGDYTLLATVKDLSGNEGSAKAMPFKVAGLDDYAQPFERTQVVWVRFNMDRDGNGQSDFVDDMLKLGFITANDPIGVNKKMIEILRDGILSQAHLTFERNADGSRRQSGSVRLYLSAFQPRGVPHSMIACGGTDPQGKSGRQYGDKSTGVLGRAFFDYRNSSWTDNNTGMNPGLGIFAGELFLFQAEVHKDLYPFYVTTFGKRFLKLVKPMGGTPVGTHSLDSKVLAKGFDVTKASAAERLRYYDIFTAAEDWARAIGIILAHEIGHSVGLVAIGPNPNGLHGDNSLHNNWPGFGQVMSSAVGYDSLVKLTYRFRDLNIAYLQQRVLMK